MNRNNEFTRRRFVGGLLRGALVAAVAPNFIPLRVLAGELAPDAGSVSEAPALRVVYFDQRRETLDPRQTLRRALAPDGE